MPQIEAERLLIPEIQEAETRRPGLVEGLLREIPGGRTELYAVAYTMGAIGAMLYDNEPVEAVLRGGMLGAFLYGVTRLVNSRIKY